MYKIHTCAHMYMCISRRIHVRHDTACTVCTDRTFCTVCKCVQYDNVCIQYEQYAQYVLLSIIFIYLPIDDWLICRICSMRLKENTSNIWYAIFTCSPCFRLLLNDMQKCFIVVAKPADSLRGWEVRYYCFSIYD